MNSPPSHTADAALIETTLPDRVAALELFLQQLVFVLDAQGAMNADALTRWICTARARMQATGSAPRAHIEALERLAQQVVE